MYITDKLEIILKSYKNNSIEFILSYYLLTHLYDLKKLNLKRVSMETKLSKSSIIRFCQYSGYKSYTVFMDELKNEIDEKKHTIDFYDHFDLLVYEEMEYDFVNECFKNLKKVYEELIKSILKSKKIFLYGHNQYLSCFKYFQTALFFQNKEVVNNMCWYIENQNDLFSSLSNDDLIIIIEPQKDWRSYKELLLIYGDTLHDLENTSAKKVFIGQEKNDAIDISITLPYCNYETFYRCFFIKLDTMLAIDINKAR